MLTYLGSLPIQQLKIDRSSVSRIVDSSRDAAIVSSLVELAHHLGLQVVAEGVAEAAVRGRLRKLGCEYGHGYLYSRSMAPAALPAWAAAPGPVRLSRALRAASA